MNNRFRTSTAVAPRASRSSAQGLALGALAAAVAALCWHGGAHAATEEQLRGIKLYGNVTIQDDSTSSWGPWSEFEAPAAGNPAPTISLTLPGADLYRPLAQTVANTAETGCVGGSICGFGAFTQIYSYSQEPSRATAAVSKEYMQELHPYMNVANVLVGPDAEGIPYVPLAIELITTPLSTGQFLMPNSGRLDLQIGEGVYYYRETDTDYYYLQPQIWTSFFDPAEVQATIVFDAGLGDYINGTEREQGQWGVIGYTTAADQMANLRASNAQATYQGYDRYGSQVDMSVNFGPGTWNGTWNGGGDGKYVYAGTTSSGGTVLQGNVGFTAQGTVQGSNFRSTSVGTTDVGATVSGYVQGAFYGPNAAAAGGVVDITKTKPAVVNTNPEQSQPASVNSGYTNGRFVSPFLAVRTELLKNRD